MKTLSSNVGAVVLFVVALYTPALAQADSSAAPQVVPSSETDARAIGSSLETSSTTGIDSQKAASEPKGEEMTPVEYQEAFKTLLSLARDRGRQVITARMIERKNKQLRNIYLVVVGLSGLSVLLLLTPLFLRKRYPGKGGLLFKYSVLSFFLTLVSINLFALSLLGLRAAQAEAAEYTNPQLAMVNGALDALESEVAASPEAAVLMGPLFEQALERMIQGESEPFMVSLVNRFSVLHDDLAIFKSIGKWFEGLDWALGMLPMLISSLVVLLFLLSFKSQLSALVALPARVASGEQRAGGAVKGAFAAIGFEVIVTAIVTIGLVGVTVLSAFFLGKLAEPAMNALITSVVGTVFYVAQNSGVSTWSVVAAVGGMAIFLILTLGVVVASGVLFLSKLQKVLRAKFHDGVPLSSNGKFFLWAPLTLAAAHIVPWLFMIGGYKGVEKLFDFVDNIMTALLISGLMLVLGLIVFLWAGRVFKGLVWLAKYKPVSGQQDSGDNPFNQARIETAIVDRKARRRMPKGTAPQPAPVATPDHLPGWQTPQPSPAAVAWQSSSVPQPMGETTQPARTETLGHTRPKPIPEDPPGRHTSAPPPPPRLGENRRNNSPSLTHPESRDEEWTPPTSDFTRPPANPVDPEPAVAPRPGSPAAPRRAPRGTSAPGHLRRPTGVSAIPAAPPRPRVSSRIRKVIKPEE